MVELTMSPPTLGPHNRSLRWRTAIVIYGALMLSFGVAALFALFLATIAASVAFGALLFGSGAVGLATLVLDWKAEGFVWRLLWSIVAVIGGLCILIHPWPGALALTLVLGASMMAQGLIAVAHAIAHRQSKTCPWGQMAFAGVLSAILGALLVWALPHVGMIVPGVFLAVNLITFGLSLIAVAVSKPRVAL